MFLGSDQRLKQLQGRLAWPIIVAPVMGLALIARLFYLQVVQHPFYEMLARENKIVSERVPGERGMIFDRNGAILVDNRPAYNVYMLPDSFLPNKRAPERSARAAALLEQVSVWLHLDPEEVRRRIHAARGRERFRPVLIKRDVSWMELSRIEESNVRSSGVFVRVEPLREYPYKEVGAHVLGYIQEVGPQQLPRMRERYPDLDYNQGDLIGKQGVEAHGEVYLRGRDGFREQIVDAFGGEVDADVLDELGFKPDNRPTVPGHNLTLTLDWELQLAAHQALGEKNGAVVALDPVTGEVLAMVSHPAFDPSPFARGITASEYRALLEAPGTPLYSKALQGQYPPGSTYKAFIAVAGLEEGLVDKNFEPTCYGRIRFGRRYFHCWKRYGHGEHVDLHEALRESCDVYFYRLGTALGIDKIAYYARLFGFGHASGIDLPGEKGGLIPTTEWKLRSRGEPWQPGETLPCAIGQGFNLVTPLQLARATAAIANGGTLVKPYVAARVTDVDGELIADLRPKVEDEQLLGFDPKSLQQVRAGLEAVVNEPHGTGWAARPRDPKLKDLRVAGKTGTAQVVHLKHTEEIENEEDIPEQFRDHAWFIAYAPADAPRIALAVLVEHGGHGGSAAAPIARAVIERFEQLRRERQSALLEPPAPIQAPPGPAQAPRRYAGTAGTRTEGGR